MRQRATKRQIVISLCILAAVAGAGYFWWPHIYFRFQLARNGVNIRRVPVAELIAPGETSGWVACRIGPLSFRLPPDILEKSEREVSKGSIIFTTPEQQLTVDIPFQLNAEILADHSKSFAAFHMSPTRIIVA